MSIKFQYYISPNKPGTWAIAKKLPYGVYKFWYRPQVNCEYYLDGLRVTKKDFFTKVEPGRVLDIIKRVKLVTQL